MELQDLRKWMFLLAYFRNGVSLVQNYRSGGLLASGPAMEEAVLWSGERITHPPHQAGLVGTILEIWYDNVYRIGDFYTPQADDVILDVGAHIGLFSIYVKRQESRCRVVALEPSQNFAYAERNVRAFGLQQVQIYRLAIGGRRGTVRIVTETNRSIDGRSVPAEGVEADSVEVVTLDDLFEIAATERIALLKMDVEGAEHDVFSQASNEALCRIDHIALEYHDHYRPGTLALLKSRLNATHEISVIPDPGTGHGRLFASRRGFEVG